MKLIKITDDHYVIVDNSEIKEGDWVLTEENTIHQVDYVDAYTKINGWKKITHSTQPLSEKCKTCTGFYDVCTDSCKVIFYNEIKELIGEVDVEKKYNETWLAKYQPYDSKEGIAFKTGYNQAIQDNKEKKYTETELRKALWELGDVLFNNNQNGIKEGEPETYFNDIIQSLQQPTTQWDVEFNSQYKLKLI